MARYPHFEQGGFLERAGEPRAVARLQMAGGEFCGNASRSFGALLAEDFTRTRQLARLCRYDIIASAGECLRFPVEVSGVNDLVEVEAKAQGSSWDVSVKIPMKKRACLGDEAFIVVSDQTVPVYVVSLEGISHVIVDAQELPFSSDTKEQSTLLSSVCEQLGLEDEPAVGLIWVKRDGNNFAIDPVVWVNSIDTCFYESACGSGSIAAALVAQKHWGTPAKAMLRQPSGATLTAGVGILDDKVICRLAGPVAIREKMNGAELLQAGNG